MHPTRNRPSKSMNIRCKGSIVLRMVRRVVTDNIDDRRPCATCIVEVGEPVRQPWSEVQQGRGRLLRHAAVTISHPGHRAFEKTEHDPHALDPPDRRDELHTRSPWM